MRSVSLNVEDRVVCLRGADLNPDCGAVKTLELMAKIILGKQEASGIIS